MSTTPALTPLLQPQSLPVHPPDRGTSAPSAPSPLLRGMMVWVLYAIPVLVAVRPVAVPLLDPDVWWHLQVGQWVIAHQTVPMHDPFSQIGPERVWVAYSWLYEIVLFSLHQQLGLAGIVLYRVAMSVAVVAAVHALVRTLEKRFLVAIGLTAIAVLALAMLFSERPWLATVLASTLTLHAVVALRQPGRSPRWIWTLPIVYILWANVHIQFIYGLFLLTLGCLAPLIDRHFRLRNPDSTAGTLGTAAYRNLVLLSCFCVLATLVNPYHVRLYWVVLEYGTQPGPFLWVNELKALEFREPTDWVMLALTGTACFALGRRRQSSAFEILLLLGTAFFAFRARRDLWFVILADLVVLASLGPRLVPDAERFSLTFPGRAAIALGLVALAVFRAWQQDLSPAGLQRRVETRFPVAAADFVRDKHLPGPLYNDFNWGGYLIWALPDLPVALDGRTNLHGDARIERFGAVWSGRPGWNEDPDLTAAGVIVAAVDTPLAELLTLSSRYERVYRDEVACVFVPRGKSR